MSRRCARSFLALHANHVIASQAKQSILSLRGEMDCFAEPASGAHSRDPLARNDGLTEITVHLEQRDQIHMASIHKEIPIDASPADVWAAVRDFASPHTRLVPGFVLDARLDGDARSVTFGH